MKVNTVPFLFYMILLIFSSHAGGYAQSIIEWDGKYQLQLSDFQSASSQVGQGEINYITVFAGMEYRLAMTNAEFMFTKNFNSMVNVTFNRNASVLIAVDSVEALNMLAFAQFSFDLAELYARKFRKAVYEEKNAFSGFDYIEPIYNRLQAEYNLRHSAVGQSSNLGQNHDRLARYHADVLAEIETYPDFCKTCKPKKIKKQKG